VDEVKTGDWGIGGRCMTAEAVRAKAAGVPA
jgi:phenylpyruvate tautomerase PptA (4-oxalocrotonate tautomerase family)